MLKLFPVHPEMDGGMSCHSTVFMSPSMPAAMLVNAD